MLRFFRTFKKIQFPWDAHASACSEFHIVVYIQNMNSIVIASITLQRKKKKTITSAVILRGGSDDAIQLHMRRDMLMDGLLYCYIINKYKLDIANSYQKQI